MSVACVNTQLYKKRYSATKKRTQAKKEARINVSLKKQKKITENIHLVPQKNLINLS